MMAPIYVGLALLIFAFGVLTILEISARRMRQRRAAAPICPTCCEFADSSRMRAALCQDPCHKQAARERVAEMRGE